MAAYEPDIEIDEDDLRHEIDTQVHKLTQTFNFLLTYRELFRGTGLEFAQLKEYVPGEDDASRIDWAASTRSDEIYVKQYEEERDLDIVVLMDASSTMKFGTQNMLKNRYAGLVAGTILRTALEIGDNAGFGMFADGLKTFIEPSQEEARYYQALDMIANQDNYGGRTNMDQTLRYILNNIQERTYLFIVSDFIGMEETWVDSLKMVSHKLQNVMGVMVRDLRDEKLPKGTGRFRLRDPHSGNTMVVNLDKARAEFERLAEEQVEQVFQGFHKSNAGIVKSFTHEQFARPLIEEMKLRATS